MGKKIVVYHAYISTVDGKGPESLAFSSLVEEDRDKYIESSPNKAWLSSRETVEDLDAVAQAALKMLSPLQKLAINVVAKPQNQLSSAEPKSSLDDPVTVKITPRFGNLQGKYFTKWRIYDLSRMFDAIFASCPPDVAAAINDVRIWYDEAADYHRLSIDILGKTIDVRYYKVLYVSLGIVTIVNPVSITSMDVAVQAIVTTMLLLYADKAREDS